MGVPLLIQANYYPSAVMYAIYGTFCLGGFLALAPVERRQRMSAVLASQGAVVPEEAMSGA